MEEQRERERLERELREEEDRRRRMGGGGGGESPPLMPPPQSSASASEAAAAQVQPEVDFAPEDLALATVPGAGSFDPTRRAFSEEELKPQPIIRKRKKVSWQKKKHSM